MGHQAAVEMLCSFGADMEAGAELGRSTPLLKAAIYIQPATLFTLIDRGATVSYQPPVGGTPLGELAWAVRRDIFLERGEDKNAELCLWLLIFAGAQWDEIKHNREIYEALGPITKAVMEVTPEVSELSNDEKNEHQRTEPKFSFSFPPKVNFQFSQWWEESIINMLSVSFNMRLPQPGTRLNYGPLEIAY